MMHAIQLRFRDSVGAIGSSDDDLSDYGVDVNVPVMPSSDDVRKSLTSTSEGIAGFFTRFFCYAKAFFQALLEVD